MNTYTLSLLTSGNLSLTHRNKHTLSNCVGCYRKHPDLQESFPGKPIYVPPSPVVLLPKEAGFSMRNEKDLARRVLSELNCTWEVKHTFSATLSKNVPEAQLSLKKSRAEKKKEDRIQKRKIAKHITEQLKENITMSVLAEGESLSSYNRKRLTLSFQQPAPQPKRKKSHSPSEQNLTGDIDGAMDELINLPDGDRLNWSALARKYHVPQKNGGQILKEIAEERGIDVRALDQQRVTPHQRRCKKRLPGGEISTPCLPTKSEIMNEKKSLVESGELTIGEPCTPYVKTKCIVITEGEIEVMPIEICGRKIPLLELRQMLLDKQLKYMRIGNLRTKTKEELLEMAMSVGYQCSPSLDVEEAYAELESYQRIRNLAMWHDHSTILRTGYILFAVWVVYDPIVFLTDDEYKTQTGQFVSNVQEVIEEPAIYMIAPSSSSPDEQLALVPDRVECLQQLTQPIVSQTGLHINDCLRFFCGDKPAQQFERGTQLGGNYKCGSCGCSSSLMQNLGYALQCKRRTLADLQKLVLAGSFGNAPGRLKPLDGLLVNDLRTELRTRGMPTSGKLKDELQADPTATLKGAQRVPTLLTQNPSQSLTDLNLHRYEVLDCEPLHDMKGHLLNLLPEITYILPSDVKQEYQLILDTTLPKGTVCGALLRTAAIKLFLKLRTSKGVNPQIVTLLCTVVTISQILYLRSLERSPKKVLQLYNCTWLHHELCSTLFSTPRKQTLNHLFGVYLHDLVVHAPLQYENVFLRSTNAESQERLFSQAKHISLRATNRKTENVLPTILLSLQAREKIGDIEQYVRKQDSIVSSVGKRLPPFEGTFVDSDFIARRIPSWQAHLQRISKFVRYGENVWWKYEKNGYRFLDADLDSDKQPQGPCISNF